MLLIKKQIQLFLTQTINKITSLCPAYNNTVVVSAVVKPGRSQSIIHIDSSGQVIHRWDYQSPIGQLGMVRDKEVIVLNIDNSTIDIINLQSKAINNINHQFKQDDVDLVQIVTFYETKYFCIVQKEIKGTNFFNLTYYGADGLLIDQYQYFEQLQEKLIVKLNNHSKMGWTNLQQDQHIELYTYNPIEKCKYFLIEFQQLNEKYQMEDNLYFQFNNLWQIKDGIFVLVCNSNRKTNNGYMVGDENRGNGSINNLIYDVHTSLVRQAYYDLYDKHEKLCNDYIVHPFFLRNQSVFCVCRNQSGNAPLLYIDNESETLVQRDTWQGSCYVNFYLPGYDDTILVLSKYDNGDVNKIEVTIQMMAQMKQIALHFMLHLNEDFADDLLQDAIELLPYD